MSRKQSRYKVMACFDTETTNDFENRSAFAIAYQLSILTDYTIPCNTITNENVNDVLDVTIDRRYDDVCKRFDELICYGKANDIVPVIMVHNLSFEMWIISSYISKHECDGCSKSTVKPLTINIKENGETVLVFWDTLSFWGKPLSVLGDECKYPKLVGCWDYGKYRTPDTPLTEFEYSYAREDVVVPWAYLGYYLRLNPEIDEHDLAYKLLTKTSVVRYKSMKRCGNIRIGKATTSKIWYKRNYKELPKSNEELELTHAATRGGFTYCAREHASRVFYKGDMNILKYDANSMHICHALAHKVPVNYRKKCGDLILKNFHFVETITVEDMLANYHNPFKNAKFYGKFHFTNVRMKKGTVFYRNGISTFASSRFRTYEYYMSDTMVASNEGEYLFNKELMERGWCDKASDDAVFAFGKFYGASDCILILNEMSAWEFSRQFDYDTVEVVGDGYLTGQTDFATQKSILSFNEFYKNKTIFKRLKGKYEKGIGTKKEDYPSFIPDYLRDGMLALDASIREDVDSFYMSVKSELNALYGIEATNEAKNKIILTDKGYEVGEYEGIEGLPDYPKSWYQYGAHIVGWSRIHQIIFMEILDDMVDAFICGDTDSHKIYTKHSSEDIDEALKPLHDACDRAILLCTRQARESKEWFPMEGLGWYECEGECDAFSASWNKSYIQLSHGKVDITMAGVPCNHVIELPDGKRIDHSYNRIANYLYENGWPFDKVAGTMLGYNVRISNNVTGLNQRRLPRWNTFHAVTGQPCSIFIYPEIKEIGNTRVLMNDTNMKIARRNNKYLNTKGIIIDWGFEDEEPKIGSF